MVAQPLYGRSSLVRIVLGIALCAFLCVPAVKAFQNQSQIQIESTGPERKVKSRVAPEYPELARRTKITGTARVEMTITTDGTVKSVKEIGGNPVLLSALVQAVKRWKYEPAPKESVMEIKAAFNQ